MKANILFIIEKLSDVLLNLLSLSKVSIIIFIFRNINEQKYKCLVSHQYNLFGVYFFLENITAVSF